MAGSTGLEPATSGLTVQCANQAAPRARIGLQEVTRRSRATQLPTVPAIVPDSLINEADLPRAEARIPTQEDLPQDGPADRISQLAPS